jgi:hypothetical protein
MANWLVLMTQTHEEEAIKQPLKKTLFFLSFNIYNKETR